MTAHADPNRDILQSILRKDDMDASDFRDAAEIVDALNPTERVQLGINILSSSIQQMTRKDRLTAFQLARKTFEGTDEEELPSTSDFLTKFVAAIDGERDPRCLLETLPLHSCIVSRLGVKKISDADPAMLEELFDVVSCYFPVTYTPPSSEKNPVLKEDLKAAVLKCCCLPLFSEYAITFAMDKVQSPVGEVKIDSLEMIVECCSTYPKESIESHLSDIWSQVRTEALQAEVRSDSMILQSIFKVVSCLTNLICNSSSDLNTIHTHLNPLLEGVLNMASLPTGFTTAKGYSALMFHVVGTHKAALSVILTRLLPLLSGAFSESQDENRRSSIISIYNAVLGGAVILKETDEDFTVQIPEFVSTAVLQMAAAAEPETLVLCSESLSSLLILQKDVTPEFVSKLAKLSLDVTQVTANSQVLLAVSRTLSASQQLANEIIKILTPELFSAPKFDYVRVISLSSAIGKSSEQNLINFMREVISRTSTHGECCNSIISALRKVSFEKKYTFENGLSLDEFRSLIDNNEICENLDFVFSTLQQDDQLTITNTISDNWDKLCLVGCGLRPGAEPICPTEVCSTNLTEKGAFFLASQLNKCNDPTPLITRFLDEGTTSVHNGILLKGLLSRGGKFSSTSIPFLKKMTDSNSIKSIFLTSNKLSGMHHKSSLLWKQKAYSCIYPALIEKYQEGGSGKGLILESLLVALTSAAKSDIEAASGTLVPIVIDFLSSNEAQQSGATSQAAVELLLAFMSQCPSCMSTAPVLGKVSPIILQASSASPFKAVRESSLKLLSLIASTPDTRLVATTIKHLVLPGIKKSLSDHKRDVRVAASDASNSWHMLV